VLRFFQISKNKTFTFFEVMYQKVVKSQNSPMLWVLIGVYHTHFSVA